ncbi:fumarylacetoacetate hydrolase family protein [Ornithinibacillus xuwenensis]|uniref:Fumarylacetoacetate hydrolase family protein n=1 Tax=Ornithinibacillus xuwenensis TaxID=3144668 RepID=A0ABU9XIX4_9BACI
MKLVSYRLKDHNDPLRIGFVLENKVVDLQEAYLQMLSKQRRNEDLDGSIPTSPNDFYKTGNAVITKGIEAYTYVQNNPNDVSYLLREEVYLSTPIPNPSKIICVGRNYVEHAAEMKSDIPDYPVLFAKFSNALIGPEDEINKTPATDKLDYEVELTVVIGKEASNVPKEDAFDFIAGYTIGNDITARDLQKRTPQWLQGKTLDRSTPIGPWVVTADEIEDPGSLVIKSYVNGEERQSSNTEKFIFDIPYLIAFISNLITLNPGDIIMTGTPDGVAFGMESPKFLQAGDLVTLEIEKIGRMENRVGDS